MANVLSDFIGELIEELQDGFENGMSDVIVFFRENIRILLEVAAGPEMGAMVSGLGTDTFMKLVTRAFIRYKENKAKRAVAAKAGQA
jgi:hypothetical protein